MDSISGLVVYVITSSVSLYLAKKSAKLSLVVLHTSVPLNPISLTYVVYLTY